MRRISALEAGGAAGAASGPEQDTARPRRPTIPSVSPPPHRILGDMPTTTAPTWAARTTEQIQNCLAALDGGLSAPSRYQAAAMALDWALSDDGYLPISGTLGPATEHNARVQYHAALFVAVNDRAPTRAEWAALDNPAPPRVTMGDTAEWGWGVWRALGWLLGEHDQPPPPRNGDTRPWHVLPPEARAEVHAAARR